MYVNTTGKTFDSRHRLSPMQNGRIYDALRKLQAPHIRRKASLHSDATSVAVMSYVLLLWLVILVVSSGQLHKSPALKLYTKDRI
jgi:hypothetical protein